MNETIQELLGRGEVYVVFRKKTNNLIRGMLCTLQRDLIPPEQHEVLAKALVDGGERLFVWDTEKNAWRSFYVSTIINYHLADEKPPLFQ